MAAAAVAVRITYVMAVTRQLGVRGDAETYHLLAQGLADGRGYVRPFGLVGVAGDVPTAEFPPLFPGLLALFDLAGVDSATGQKLALAFVGALTTVVVGTVARQLAGAAAGIVAAGVVAFHPAFFESDAGLMAESLYVLTVAAVLSVAYVALRRAQPGWWAALGALIGVAALVRTEALALLFVLVLPAALLRRRPGVVEGERRQRATLAAVAALAGIAVISPWTVRNALVLDAFVPVSSNAGTLLAGANCDAVYSGGHIGLWDFGCVLAVDAPHDREAARNAAYLSTGLDYMVDHAGAVPRVAAIRALRTWGAYDPAGQLQWETLENRHAGWHRFGYGVHVVVVAFAVPGAVWLGRRTTLLPVVAMGVMVTAVSATGYGNQRFRGAADVALAILAGAAIAALVARRSRASNSHS